MNLQDSFLNQVRKDAQDIRIVMLDGREIVGKVRGFDNFTVILQTEKNQVLLYKHAVAQMFGPRTISTRREEHAPARSREQAPARKSDAAPAQKSEPVEDASKKKENKFNAIDLSNVQLAPDKT